MDKPSLSSYQSFCIKMTKLGELLETSHLLSGKWRHNIGMMVVNYKSDSSSKLENEETLLSELSTRDWNWKWGKNIGIFGLSRI